MDDLKIPEKVSQWTDEERERKAPEPQAPSEPQPNLLPQIGDTFPLRGLNYRVRGIAPGPNPKSLALWVEVVGVTKALRKQGIKRVT